jgi:acetyl-CoA carboxylase carboxyl transferase subunit beta
MAPTSAREWLDLVLDQGWTLLFEDVVSGDPLNFPGYAEQLRAAREKTGCTESVLVAEGTINDHIAIAISFEFGFMGGSMGVAAGERICRAFERATELGIPVIALTASGGARMQEGMLALVQMPATIVARENLAAAGCRFICYLRNPTTGGVFASFASTADLLWAEPEATIGFAGPRVAESVTGETLSQDSHTAESAYRASLIDELIEPEDLRARIRDVFGPGMFGYADNGPMLDEPRQEAPSPPWEEVTLARHPKRPTGTAFVDPGIDLRRGGSDPTVHVVWMLESWQHLSRPIFIAQDRYIGDGRTRPGGYQRIRRAIDYAVRFDHPIVTLIDTPGASPSSVSETSGIAREIAMTFEALLTAPVPIVAVVVGEGGSGGALALAAADALLIMEHAIFSVIAPEGAAAILRRDDVERIAADLHLTARDLRESGLADAVIAEPDGGAHLDPPAAITSVRNAIVATLEGLLPSAGQLESAGAYPSARRLERWRVHR